MPKSTIDHLQSTCNEHRDECIQAKTAAAKRESELDSKVQSLEIEVNRLGSQVKADDSSADMLGEARIRLTQLNAELEIKEKEIAGLRFGTVSNQQGSQQDLERMRTELAVRSCHADDLLATQRRMAVELAYMETDLENLQSQPMFLDAEVSAIKERILVAGAELNNTERAKLRERLQLKDSEIRTIKAEHEKTAQDGKVQTRN